MEVIKGKEPVKQEQPSFMKATGSPTTIQKQIEQDGGSGYQLPDDLLTQLTEADGESSPEEQALLELAKEMGIETGEQEPKAKVAKPAKEDKPADEPEEEEDPDLAALKKDLKGDTDDTKKVVNEADLVEVNGEKVSLDDLKKGYMKEKDYRNKTMAIADERRDFEKEKMAYVEEYKQAMASIESEINVKKQFDSFIDFIEASDPDFYSEVKAKFEASQKQMRNPFFESQLNKLAEENRELKKKFDDVDVQREKASYNEGMREVKQFVKKYEHLGLKWTEQEVAKAWAQSTASPLQVFKSIYGDQILTLAESKAKLAKLQNKNKGTMPNAGKVRSTGSGATSSKDTKKMSYSQITEALLAGQLR